MISLITNLGQIDIALDHENAPQTSSNFLKYINDNFYSNTIFHRVIPGFMIQGGGFTADMTQKKTNPPIKNEANKSMKNNYGTIAMARTSDPHSATAQFFINVKDNAFLNYSAQTAQGWGYCVFGKVVAGMEVVEKIVQAKTTSKGGHENVPLEDIIIEKVVVKEEASNFQQEIEEKNL